MEQKVKSIIKSLLVIGWFICSQALVGVIFQLCLGGSTYNNYYETHMYRINWLSQVLCFSVLIYWDYKKEKNFFGRKQLGVFDYCKYVFYGIGVWLLSCLINAVLLPYFPDYNEIDALFTNRETVGRFIVLVIASPILEEYLFRGKIQTYLKRGFGKGPAIIGQALLFGSLHGLALQKIYASFIGIVFGLVKEKEQSIKVTMIMHMTVNFIGWLIGTFS